MPRLAIIEQAVVEKARDIYLKLPGVSSNISTSRCRHPRFS